MWRKEGLIRRQSAQKTSQSSSRKKECCGNVLPGLGHTRTKTQTAQPSKRQDHPKTRLTSTACAACYTSPMAKKTTLKEIGEMLAHIVKHMATKEETASKDQLVVLQTQVNGIETDIRSMKHGKLEVRVADLEEKVFGKTHD
jgi:hypothetical protein